MLFNSSDTKERYRSTLVSMEAGRMTNLADEWPAALLGLIFSDLNRAHLSVRDTLVPMLEADQRQTDAALIHSLLNKVALDQTAGDTAGLIHQTYLSSTPKG